MGKYVLAYKGGGMAATEEERNASMEKWGAWFGSLGGAVADMGAPFSGSAAVTAGGGNGTAGSGLTGYSVVTAGSLDDAVGIAEGCPILDDGGSVDVYEAMEM
jgi:hypothetical protein